MWKERFLASLISFISLFLCDKIQNGDQHTVQHHKLIRETHSFFPSPAVFLFPVVVEHTGHVLKGLDVWPSFCVIVDRKCRPVSHSVSLGFTDPLTIIGWWLVSPTRAFTTSLQNILCSTGFFWHFVQFSLYSKYTFRVAIMRRWKNTFFHHFKVRHLNAGYMIIWSHLSTAPMCLSFSTIQASLWIWSLDLWSTLPGTSLKGHHGWLYTCAHLFCPSTLKSARCRWSWLHFLLFLSFAIFKSAGTPLPFTRNVPHAPVCCWYKS